MHVSMWAVLEGGKAIWGKLQGATNYGLSEHAQCPGVVTDLAKFCLNGAEEYPGSRLVAEHHEGCKLSYKALKVTENRQWLNLLTLGIMLLWGEMDLARVTSFMVSMRSVFPSLRFKVKQIVEKSP
ncbi:hypothetical protein PR048_024761 [Dryococelus australis]|uniref:Uncharacterized protein n=1 Tax=Dryococelus australis TaxID=614101 RepID=A0ABQ9GPJ3_9NEOP|nr:hypothetical protein PR048_024761 [Dryococelus australis]